MQPIDVQFLQKPKPIPSLPFKQIWVIDNYLPPSIHDSWYESRFSSSKWGRQNRVIRNDKIRHLYWGESIYINIEDRGWERKAKSPDWWSEQRALIVIGGRIKQSGKKMLYHQKVLVIDIL